MEGSWKSGRPAPLQSFGCRRATKPKKKHLLHKLGKRVLIHSRETVEIWYCLPNSQRFANSNIWLPGWNRLRTRPGRVELEVYFRIVHIAKDSQHNGPAAVCCNQAVEITSGPKREGGTNPARIALVNLQESFR